MPEVGSVVAARRHEARLVPALGAEQTRPADVTKRLDVGVSVVDLVAGEIPGFAHVNVFASPIA
jgi:hypothetical protein